MKLSNLPRPRLGLAGALALGLTLSLSGAAAANTWYVATTGGSPADGTAAHPFPTVQQGVDFASAGDTVLVADGRYTPSGGTIVHIGGKDITVRSVNGAQNCILDAGGSIGRPVEISGVTANCVLDGFTVRGGVITAGAGGGYGGGIYISNASPTLRNCIIRDNTATNASGDAAGGGILISQGSPVLTNCQILNNSVGAGGKGFGGGVEIDQGSPVFRDCVISGNTVTSSASDAYGGGLDLEQSGTTTLFRCTVSNNSATVTSPSNTSNAYGGGIRTQNVPVSLVRTTLSGNAVTCDGGITAGAGLYLTTTASLERCTVSGNQIKGVPVTAFGAGVYAVGGTLSVVDTSVTENTCGNVLQSSVAGGIGIAGPVTATLLRCTIARNTLSSDRSSFLNGDSGPQGGGVTSGGTLTMSGCTLQGNTVHGSSSSFANGGGFYQSTGTSTVHNCLFLGNDAIDDHVTNFGGGAYVAGGSCTFANCVFIGNRIDGTNNGGGAGLQGRYGGTTVKAVNCVFFGNSVNTGINASSGGGVSAWNSASITLQNSILRGDSAPSDAEIGNFSSTISVAYSDVQGGIPSGATNGGHNIDADPQFVRTPLSGGATDFGDLHLNAGSPCINTGNAAAPGIAPYDLDGFARNEGGAPDMGVYETRQNSGLVYDIYVDTATGDDLAGTGTAAEPFKTVARALALTDPLGYAHIHVQQGNYGSDTPHVTGKVQFLNWNAAGRASIGKP